MSNQQRMFICVALATVMHAAGLISFQMAKLTPQDRVQSPTLDIVLTPPPTATSPKSNPASLAHGTVQTVSTDKQASYRKRTVSMTHHQPEDAAYLTRWQAYIEEVGNDHVLASQKKLSGSLRLMVAVNKDGSLKAVFLRQSSGDKELDKTAIDIVNQAAPFEPLPSAVAHEIDVLEIIRTWQFNTLETAKS